MGDAAHTPIASFSADQGLNHALQQSQEDISLVAIPFLILMDAIDYFFKKVDDLRTLLEDTLAEAESFASASDVSLDGPEMDELQAKLQQVRIDGRWSSLSLGSNADKTAIPLSGCTQISCVSRRSWAERRSSTRWLGPTLFVCSSCKPSCSLTCATRLVL